jgi:DNA repair exonuclease SbcCD ATPase subunit
MASFLQGLRRSSSTDNLTELRQLVERLDAQHTNLERLVQHADRSIAQLQRLGTLGERVAAIEKQVNRLEELPPRLGAAEKQADALTASHQRVEAGLGEATGEMARIKTEVEQLAEVVGATRQLKNELSGFLALEQPFGQLRADMNDLQAQSQTFRAELARARADHEATVSSHRAAAARLEGFDGEWQRVTRTLTETEHRIAGLEQLLGDFGPVTESVAQTRRQLATAKATADQLSQKVQLLEQQRDQVDRATAKLEHLTDLVQRADVGLERQDDIIRNTAMLRAQLDALAEEQRAVREQSSSTGDRVSRLEMTLTGSERILAMLRQALDQNVERLANESRSIEGVSERVQEVRRSLLDGEKRLTDLTAGTEAIAAAAARADGLTTQVAQIGSELARVSDIGSRVQAGLADLETLEATISGLTERTCRLEEARPGLERAMRDLGSLSATQEAIRDALEQLRGAREELSESKGRVEHTRNWLSETERQVDALRNDVAALDRSRSTVDTLRQELDQLSATTRMIESRKNVVEDLQRRLADAMTLTASMEERARELSERLETAEDHVGTLVPRLDEVGRAGSQLLTVSADLREMEQLVGAVQDSVSDIEDRARGLERLSEKMHELSRDIDQRQTALKRAGENLDRAATLRQEATEAAQLLAERSREINALLEQSTERLGTLTSLSRDLDTRAGFLQGIQERMTSFESRLAEWRGVEQQLAQTMEQAAGRQASVAALQAEIRLLYDKVERAQNDARAVIEAQPRITSTRTELEDIMAKLDDSDGVMKTLVDRRRQLDRAEERLAHADLLLSDLRASLEILLAQKAQVDYFLEQAGALALEAKQAESLLATLREERRVSDRIRGALSDLRRRDEAAAAGEVPMP